NIATVSKTDRRPRLAALNCPSGNIIVSVEWALPTVVCRVPTPCLGDRPEGTYRFHGQYQPDAQASACIFCVAMECTRLRVGLVLVCFHLPIALTRGKSRGPSAPTPTGRLHAPRNARRWEAPPRRVFLHHATRRTIQDQCAGR